MSEVTLKAFRTETDILNKGIGRNIPSVLGNTSLDPNTSHSIWNINNWTGGGGDDGPDPYARALEEEKKRQAKVDAGLAAIEEVFSQYDQDFYDETSDAYLDYYTPQLEDQYKDGLRELQFALARGGRFNSSTEVDKKGGAAEDLEFQRQELMGNATKAADQTEQSVLDAKERMIKLNEVNANPDLAASLSASQAGVLNQPPKYDPLVDVFADITEGLAKREEIENRRKIRDGIELVKNIDSSRTI